MIAMHFACSFGREMNQVCREDDRKARIVANVVVEISLSRYAPGHVDSAIVHAETDECMIRRLGIWKGCRPS